MQITFLETTTGTRSGLMGSAPQMEGGGLCVIMPATDLGQAVHSARRMIAMAEVNFQMVIVNDPLRQGFVKTFNQAVKVINPGFVAYVAQDALAGVGWLRLACEALSAEGKSLCGFNDGTFGGRIAQFGLARTAFTYAHYGEGNVFFPGYHTHRADDELTLLASTRNQYVYAQAALLMEVEFRLRRAENRPDVELFARRKAIYEAQQAPPA
jgi:hypothetical protein